MNGLSGGAHRCQRPRRVALPLRPRRAYAADLQHGLPDVGLHQPQEVPQPTGWERATPGPDPPDSSRPSVERLERSPPGLEHGTEIYRRVAPLHAATQAAVAIEPEVAALDSTVATTRRAGMRTLMASLPSRRTSGRPRCRSRDRHPLPSPQPPDIPRTGCRRRLIHARIQGLAPPHSLSTAPYPTAHRRHQARRDRNVTQHRARERTRVKPVPVDGLVPWSQPEKSHPCGRNARLHRMHIRLSHLWRTAGCLTILAAARAAKLAQIKAGDHECHASSAGQKVYLHRAGY
jgi:hypothetical protein